MDNNIEVDSWKKSRTTMIPKVKKSTAAQLSLIILRPIEKAKTEPGNYRPVSVLSIMSKVMERVICEQLNDFIEKHDYLYELQSGFARYVNRFFYDPFILRRYFIENLRITFQTEIYYIDTPFCDTCQF